MEKKRLNLELGENQLNGLMPFFLCLDKNLKIQVQGKSSKKLLGDLRGKIFNDYFILESPLNDQVEYQKLINLTGEVIIFKLLKREGVKFRGQFIFFEAEGFLTFMGSLLVESLEELDRHGLEVSDFAPMDPLIESLKKERRQNLLTQDLQTQLKALKNYNNTLEKFGDFIQTCGVGLIIVNSLGLITYANRAFLTQSGFDQDAVLGNTPVEIIHCPLTEKAKVDQLAKSVNRNEELSMVLKHRRADSSWFWAKVKGEPISDKNGLFSFYALLIEDVSDQKSDLVDFGTFDHTFQKFFESTGDNIWKLDLASGKTTVSNFNKNLLGWELDAESDWSQIWEKQIHPDDIQLVNENKLKLISGEIDYYQLQYRVFNQDDTCKWILERGFIHIRDSNGVPHEILGTHSDITEFKLVEEELVRVNSKLNSVFNELRDVIWSVKYPEFKTLFFTPSAETLFELDMETLMNDTEWWNKVVHPDDAHVLEEIMQEIGISGEYTKVYRLRMKSGKIKWVENKGRVIYENGIAVRLDGFLSEISEKKKAEELLLAEEKLKNKLIEISFAYFNMDLEETDDEILKSLQGIGEFVGADRAYVYSIDLVRNNCSCTFEWCSDGVSSVKGAAQDVQFEKMGEWIKAHQKGESFLIENIGLINPKERTELASILQARKIKSLISIPMIYQGELLGFIGFDSVRSNHFYSNKEQELLSVFAQLLINVQVRQQVESKVFRQEERFRNIISNMNLGVLEIDKNDVILHANQTYSTMSGIPVNELIGRKTIDFHLDGKAKKLIKEKANLREQGFTDFYELKYLTPDQQSKWWLVSGSPNYNDKNEITGSIRVFLDITNQKVLEEELIAERETAVKARRAKEMFFGNMSNEIRTPMNAILGMGEQLSRTKLDEKQKSYLEAIRLSADHLLEVIRDLLDLTKIEDGKMTLQKQGFYLKQTIDKVFEMLRPKAEEKGLIFNTVSFDPKLNKILLGDPERINQIVFNLVSNAIKFTEKGWVNVTCKLISENSKSQKIELEIEDTGIGMHLNYYGGEIQKYDQETLIESNIGGAGLGLNISQELVILMGGELEIDSKKELGTKVTVKLTLDTGAKMDFPESNPEIKLNRSSLSDKRILVVDDNEFNRFFATTVLEQQGIVVSTAESAAKAIELVKKNIFDLVLMDIQMPIMDGVKATQIIRKDLKSKVPIIALTAYAGSEDRERYLLRGMDGFLTKPFQEMDLLSEIRTVFQADFKKRIRLLPSKRISENYSINQIWSMAKGKEAFVVRLMELFFSNVDQGMSEAMEAFVNKEYKLIKKILHRIKPSISSFEVNLVLSEIQELEAEIEGQADPQKIELLLFRINKGLKLVTQEIKDDYGDYFLKPET